MRLLALCVLALLALSCVTAARAQENQMDHEDVDFGLEMLKDSGLLDDQGSFIQLDSAVSAAPVGGACGAQGICKSGCVSTTHFTTSGLCQGDNTITCCQPRATVTPTPVTRAPVGGACGNRGICKSGCVSTTHFTTAGLCQGDNSISCCQPRATVTPTPVTPTPVTPAPVGGACGNRGICKSGCVSTTHFTTSGLCQGDNSISCCQPRATVTPTPVTPTPVTPTPVTPPSGGYQLTAAQLAAAVGISSTLANTWLAPINAVATRYAINTPRRMAHFLAQIGHESGSLARVEENLNYSAEGLVATWPSRFTTTTARSYARQPQKIANKVYASRMGNGPESSNDGWTFRGRGLIQITGRETYRTLGVALGQNFVTTPALLLQPTWAAMSAGWYWNTRGLNAYADIDYLVTITEQINGGQNGLDDRRARFTRARTALGVR